MANNLNYTNPVTGSPVATDDVGSVQYQVVKLDGGPHGVSLPLTGTAEYGLGVDVNRILGTPEVAIKGPAAVSGTVLIGNEVTVSPRGPVAVSGTVSIGNEVTVNVRGPAPVSGTISIGGEVTINARGPVAVSGTLSVDSEVTVNVRGPAPISGAVSLTGMPTVSLNGPAAVSGGVSIVGQSAVTALLSGGILGQVSSLNSTVTLLAASGTFTGAREDVSGYGGILVSVVGDRASQANGVAFAFSPDGNTFTTYATATYAGASGLALYRLPVLQKFFRVSYTNTNTAAQSTFLLQTLLQSAPVAGLDASTAAYVQQVAGPWAVSGTLLIGSEVTVNPRGPVAVSGTVTIGNEVTVNPRGPVGVSGTVSIGNEVTVNARGPVGVSGTVLIGNEVTVNPRGPVAVSGTVLIGGEVTTNPRGPVQVSGTVLIGNEITINPRGPVAVSGLVSIVGQSAVTALLSGFVYGCVSSNNSSATALAASGSFSGTKEDVSGYSAITVTIISDKASQSNGIQFAFSQDGISFTTYATGVYNGAATAQTWHFPVWQKFFRITYFNTNSGPQIIFALQTILHSRTPPVGIDNTFPAHVVQEGGPWAVSGTLLVGNEVTVNPRGPVAVSGTVDTELPAAAALTDANANPTAPIVGAGNLVYDAPTGLWQRARSLNVSGHLTAAGVPVAAALFFDYGTGIYRAASGTVLADGMGNPVVQQVGSHLLIWNNVDLVWGRWPTVKGLADTIAGSTLPAVGSWAFNGTTWDRLRTDGAKGLMVGGSAASGAAATGNPVRVGGVNAQGILQDLLVDGFRALVTTAQFGRKATYSATTSGTQLSPLTSGSVTSIAYAYHASGTVTPYMVNKLAISYGGGTGGGGSYVIQLRRISNENATPGGQTITPALYDVLDGASAMTVRAGVSTAPTRDAALLYSWYIPIGTAGMFEVDFTRIIEGKGYTMPGSRSQGLEVTAQVGPVNLTTAPVVAATFHWTEG
jgi:hypothetical protein